MTESIMQVSIDEHNTVSIQYHGKHNSLLNMLGGLDVAKDWVLKSIKNRSTQEEITPISDEVSVSKSEAINYWLKERNEIESRLQAIAKSDDRANFIIKDN